MTTNENDASILLVDGLELTNNIQEPLHAPDGL